jgi:hypothetical protein
MGGVAAAERLVEDALGHDPAATPPMEAAG